MRSHLRWWHNPKRAIAIAALGPPHVESSCCRLACRGNGIEESEKSCDLIIEVRRRLDMVEALVRKEEKRWWALVLLDPAQPIFMVDGRSEVRAQAATSCLFEKSTRRCIRDRRCVGNCDTGKDRVHGPRARNGGKPVL
jgi:hypothetical protein